MGSVLPLDVFKTTTPPGQGFRIHTRIEEYRQRWPTRQDSRIPPPLHWLPLRTTELLGVEPRLTSARAAWLPVLWGSSELSNSSAPPRLYMQVHGQMQCC